MALLISLDAMPVPLANSDLLGWVDPVDWDFVMQRTWRYSSRHKGQLQYVQARGVARRSPLLHRTIADRMGLSKDALIDHRDRNCLNCTRENLRAATHAQNLANSAARNQCGYKGVAKTPFDRWAVQIMVRGKIYRPGNLETPEAAARVYDQWAKAAWGEFACFNFPEHA